MSHKDASQKETVSWPLATVLGGFAGMVATTVVHPLDLIKVRLQLLSRYCSTHEMAQLIVQHRGWRGLYVGLSAGLLRQTTYTTTRLGVFHALNDLYRRDNEQELALREKLIIGIGAGLAGALAGAPSDVALVRIMADGPLEPFIICTCKRQYRGTFHALSKIYKDEGFYALWRGGTLTLGRSVLVSVAQLGSYAQVREMFRERKLAKGLSLHVYTSLISSFLTAVVSLPIDVVKTKYQAKKGGVKQSEILADILHFKGYWYLWKGFVPYYIRMAVHTTLSYLVYEQLLQTYRGFTDSLETEKKK